MRNKRRNALMSLKAMNRRTFLETTTTVAAATLLTGRFGWAAGEHKIEKIGVQLYTVRDQMKTDFDGTIAKVAQIGYKEVEFAGYFGHTAQQVRAVCEKNGLDPVSTHVQYDELDAKFPSVIEDSKTIGLKYVVCPWIPEDIRKNPDIWKQAAEKFNHCGEQTQKAGMQFAYHNHWFEFLPVNGKLPSCPHQRPQEDPESHRGRFAELRRHCRPDGSGQRHHRLEENLCAIPEG